MAEAAAAQDVRPASASQSLGIALYLLSVVLAGFTASTSSAARALSLFPVLFSQRVTRGREKAHLFNPETPPASSSPASLCMGYIDSLLVQFRSSRSNRHLQHENVPRVRGGMGGPIDHDPTEGLPVKKWQLSDVTVKQVEKNDDGDEAKTGSINPDYPWPELPLPKDFHQLPLHSQEILRRARMGNTRVRPAIYNPTTGTYTSAPALNTTTLKSKHLANNNIPAVPNAVSTPPADIDMLDEDPEADITAQPKPTLDEDRTFTVRKWVLVPAAEAEKRPEPKYLADRRPGLKNVYGYGQAGIVNTTAESVAATGTTLGAVANAAGEEISSTGLELSTVGGIGMGTSASAPVAEPPRRRGPPPPPKRKKKGGLGRRKKVLADQTPGDKQGQSVTGVDGTADEAGTGNGMIGVKAEDVEDVEAGAKDGEEDDGSGSDDGEEGSEEGEIDEGDVTMNADVAAEAKEPEVLPAVPTPGTAEVGKGEDVPMAEAAEAAILPIAEVSQAEEGSPSAAPEVKDLVEEHVSPTGTESASLVEKESLPAAAVVEERNSVQEAATPAPAVEAPPVEEAEVDLLGSLDRAVEGMQGANADAMDTTEEKHVEGE